MGFDMFYFMPFGLQKNPLKMWILIGYQYAYKGVGKGAAGAAVAAPIILKKN